MASAMRSTMQRLGLPLDEACRMASTYPAEFLGLGHELARIAPEVSRRFGRVGRRLASDGQLDRRVAVTSARRRR